MQPQITQRCGVKANDVVAPCCATLMDEIHDVLTVRARLMPSLPFDVEEFLQPLLISDEPHKSSSTENRYAAIHKIESICEIHWPIDE